MSLARDGYARLARFVAPAEVPSLRAAAVAHEGDPDGCARPNNTLLPLTWDSAVVRTLLSQRRVAAVAAATDATDLRWISGYVSVKEPRSAPLWWHQDWWCWEHPVSFEPRAAQVAVLVYLTDTDERRGALRVLPGSHRRSASIHARLPAAHRAASPEAFARLDGQVTLPARAGDAVAMDYRLLHATHANDDDRRRDAVILNFAPDWSSLPADVRAHLIRHPALDGAPADPLLPRFDGEPRDLRLSRDAPAEFAI